MSESPFDILELQKMFDDCKKEEEEPQEEFQQTIEPKEQDTFWDEDEITPVGFYKDPSDTRPEPIFEQHYKQTVGTGDVYLGLSMKDNSIADADTIVVTVTLPDTNPDDIELNVQNGYLDLRCPKYRLTLKLEKPTKDSETTAKWLANSSQLRIEVPIIPPGMKYVV